MLCVYNYSYISDTIIKLKLMKNLKKMSRENLKTIKGGLKYCGGGEPCGEGWCCAGSACRPINSPYCPPIIID